MRAPGHQKPAVEHEGMATWVQHEGLRVFGADPFGVQLLDRLFVSQFWLLLKMKWFIPCLDGLLL